jgi:hypothetical protein
MLELADPGTLVQKTFYYKLEEDNEFEVEQILEHQQYGVQKSENEYLVKWLGYNDSENT